MTPGVEAGDILVAGGDTSGKLGGIFNLATSTNASATAEIFDTTSNTFAAVGSLNTKRESSAAVALPNGEVLIVGGASCGASGFQTTNSGAFLCTSLQTAELYNENTKAFTLAGSGSGHLMTIGRSGPSATLIEGSGTALDGQVLIVGGSTGVSFLSGANPAPAGQPAATALNTAELYNPATDTFTAVANPIPPCPAGESPLTTPACTNALSSVCNLPVSLTPITSATASGTTATITTSGANPAGLTIGSSVTVAGVTQTALNGPTFNGVYTVTALPASNQFQYTAATSGLASSSGGFASAGNLLTASESGTTVSVVTVANPPGLTIGDLVTVSGVKIGTATISTNGYDGTFTVATIADGTHFTYTATATGLGAGVGGYAASNTFECGMVDQGAALISSSGTALDGQVLLAGGDLITFLGESSNLSFLFDPSTQMFTKTTGNLITPRELFPMVAMSNPPVTTGVVGKVVAFGGVEANSAFCTIPAQIVATTLSSAEVFDPATQTWSATFNSMGVKRAAVATLIAAGSLSGEVIIPGGVDVEAGTLPSSCIPVTSLAQTAQSEADLYEPGVGTGGTFTATTGSLNAAREGPGQGVIGSGTMATDVLVVGGACTQVTPSLQSAVIGTTQATTTCGNAKFDSDYSEVFNQGTGLWTLGPGPASGFAPSNAAASAVLP